MELVEVQEADLGLNLRPAVEARVGIGAGAIQALGADLRESTTRVVGLKDRAQSADLEPE